MKVLQSLEEGYRADNNELKRSIKKPARRLLINESLFAINQDAADRQKLKYSISMLFVPLKKLIGFRSIFFCQLLTNGTQYEIETIGLNAPTQTDRSPIPCSIARLLRKASNNGRTLYRNHFRTRNNTVLISGKFIKLENILITQLVFKKTSCGLLMFANKPGGFTKNDKCAVTTLLECNTRMFQNSTKKELLKKSEKKFRSVVETASDAILTNDSLGNLVTWNKAAETIFGYSADEIVGKHFTLLIPDRFRVNSLRAMEQLRFLEGPNSFGKMNKFPGLRKDGNEFPAEISYAKWKTPDGVFFTSIVRDVTDRVRAENALKESEERFRAIAESSNDAIITSNSKGEIVFWNKAAEKIFGYKASEILGKNDVITTPDRFKHLHTKAKKKWLEDKFLLSHPRTLEQPILRKDGTEIPTEISISTWKMNNETFFSSIVRDISERKKAEEQIRESKEFLENVFKTSTDGIIITDRSGCITMINTAVEKMFGYSRDELLGKYTAELHPKGKKHEKQGWDFVSKLFEKGVVIGVEGIWSRKDGRSVHIERNATILKDDKGNTSGSLISIRDITQRKHAEKALAKAYYELEKRVQERTANLNAVNVQLKKEVFEREKAEKKLIANHKQLQTLSSELSLAEERARRHIANNLHDRISQTLAICKMQLSVLRKGINANNLDAALKDVYDSIAQAMKDTRSLILELRPPILYELGLEAAIKWLIEQNKKQHGFNIDFHCQKKLKQIDNDMSSFLFHAVRELLFNVAKHAQTKALAIKIRAINSTIIIEVKDNGVGFDVAAIEPDVNKMGGFGLFSIRERLHYLGGSLAIKSKPGHGTHIIMQAPIQINKKPARDKIKWA